MKIDNPTNLFLEWLEALKQLGISNSLAATRSGMSADKVKNMKRGGSSAEIEDLLALANAFPAELGARAQAIGIKVNAPAGLAEADFLRVLSELQKDNEQMKQMLKEVRDRTLSQETILELLKLLNKKSC